MNNLPILIIHTILFLLFNCVLCNGIPPHIILIVADDMGWNDCGHHGSNQILTPNLDAMAYQGVPLWNFVSQHICTPSRAALLTGNYPIHTGMQGTPLKGGEDRHLPVNISTLPKLLKNLDYDTHLVGKWHLGASYPWTLPAGHGFDSYFGYYNGFVSYREFVALQENVSNQNFYGFDLHDNLTPLWKYQGRYATDLFTEKAEDIIDNHNLSRPLYLQISHLAAHTGKDGVSLEVRNETVMNQRYSYIVDVERRKYADIITVMDESIGRIFAKLSQRNMLENSIVVFLSDNGAQTIGMYQNYGSNWPLRGLKFSLLQGGVRTPAALFSPLLKSRRYVNKQLIHITDLMPTLYRVASGHNINLKIDGQDQWETISQNQLTQRQEVLVNIDEVLNFSSYVGMNGKYKLVKGCYNRGIYDGYYGESGRGSEVPNYNYIMVLQSPTNLAIERLEGFTRLTKENIDDMRSEMDLGQVCRDRKNNNIQTCCNDCLFNLEEDPCETQDIKELCPVIYSALNNKLEEFRRGLIPQKNQPADPASNPKFYNNTWCTWKDDRYCFKTPEPIVLLKV